MSFLFAAKPNILDATKLEKDKKPLSVRVCVKNGYTVGVQVFIKRAIKLSPNLVTLGYVRSVDSANTSNKLSGP